MKRYCITWKEQSGAKGQFVTNHIRNKWVALTEFSKMKPHIDLSTVKVRAWDINCKEK